MPRPSRSQIDQIHRSKLRVDSPVCYWEITASCPMRCTHCWYPHKPPTQELTTEEALAFCDDLAGLGTRSVHLTGGEVLMRPDWERIAGKLHSLGIAVHLRTSGVGLDEAAMAAMTDVGVRSVTIPLDGPPAVHDSYRPTHDPATDPYGSAVRAIGLVRDSAASLKVATQVNRHNQDHLPELRDTLVEMGVERWKVQLCRPDVTTFGHRELYPLPEDLPRLFDFLEQTHEQGRIRIMPAHTLGYYTRLEPLLRPRRGRQPPIWMGCEAGLKHFVVESDGKVKGCISLPSNFATASIRERPIAEIWADDEVFAYTRAWQDEWFDGECAGCAYRDLCRAGCTAVAYGSTGSVGYNPYCMHRVTELIE